MANATLGVLIEDMATRGVESDLDGVACAGLGARGDAGDEVGTVVDVTELMGAEIYLYLNVGKSEEGDGKIKIVNEGTNMIARVSSRSTSRAGDTVKVAFDTARIHIFDKDTERCICH